MVKNASHTLAYSLIALQEMNLVYKYPIIFWNCACLISDSGGNEQEENNEEDTVEETPSYFNEMEEFAEDDNEDDIEDSYNEEDCDGIPVEVVVLKNGKKKKKIKATNYGKIATAIGKMKTAGIDVVPPDINKSNFTFSPDVDNSVIRFGISGIVKIGEDLIKRIIENRPYISIEDFLNKVKINKPQMINLIKAGAFDEFGRRSKLMSDYANLIADKKKRVTLQNMKMLIDFGLIPEEYDLQKKVYNFNKYLKKRKIGDKYYGLDNIALSFYEKNFDIDVLFPSEDQMNEFYIKQTTWDKLYQGHMDIIRPFVKKNNISLLNSINETLVQQIWEKYCLGTIGKWEMDAVSCYFHQHELEFVDNFGCECSNFYDLPEEPEIERVITIKGKQIPLFYIRRIMGTVLDKNKAKKTLTLLTIDGVVTVKIFGDVFTHYDRQISEKGLDGKKHVIEKSWFSRGNKIIVTGIRRNDSFVAKKYSRTPYHLIELITDINEDGTVSTRGERMEVVR